MQVAASLTVLAHPVAPGAASIFGLVTAWAARGLAASAGLVDWLPWLALRMPAPAVWVAASYLLGLAGGRRRVAPGAGARQRPAPSGAARSVDDCRGVRDLDPRRRPPRGVGRGAPTALRVVSLDVGQGDATLVEFPDGRRWLVDAGGLPGSQTFDIGERVVAPALWARGTGRLDRLLLTHGDPDHMGGAAAVIDDFRPAVFDGVPVPSHVPLQALRDHARARRRRGDD